MQLLKVHPTVHGRAAGSTTVGVVVNKQWRAAKTYAI